MKQKKIIITLIFLFGLFSVVPEALAINRQKKVAGPGWHIKTKKTDAQAVQGAARIKGGNTENILSGAIPAGSFSLKSIPKPESSQEESPVFKLEPSAITTGN